MRALYVDRQSKKEKQTTAAALGLEMTTTLEAVAQRCFKKERARTPDHQKKIISHLETQLFPILGTTYFHPLNRRFAHSHPPQ